LQCVCAETKAQGPPVILSLFRRKEPSPIPLDLHDAIVAEARSVALYADFGVPDTVTGRFEMVVLHAHLFLRRARREQDRLGDLAQEVVDRTFLEFDRALREMGVGDTSVPRKMKTMARAFYGRGAAYDPALDARDVDALASVLRRVVFEDKDAGDPRGLALRVLAMEAHLTDAVSAGDLLEGIVSFRPSATP
jgi:cytochrome b pre-mRNA-processing protein 3